MRNTGMLLGSECCAVMQISMRMQIIVGIWVLVSMMDFMPGKGEHEAGICHFTGKAVRRCGVTLMSTGCHTSIEASTKWRNMDYVVLIEVHVFFFW